MRISHLTSSFRFLFSTCTTFSMPGTAVTSMETLVKNAEAAERLIDDINTKIQAVQRRVIAGDGIGLRNTIEAEQNRVREEIKKWQQYLTLLQIRNGGMYYQTPAPSSPVITSTGSGDAPPAVPVTTVKVEKSEPLPSAAVSTTSNNVPKVQQQSGDKKVAKKDGGAKPKGQVVPPAADDVVDVGKLDFRIGKIVEVDRHPDADSLYVEKVDVGEPNPRTVVSGLVKHVPLDEMKDRMVVLLCNLKPAKMRGVTSEAMVMCASTPEKVEILIPPPGSVPGDLIDFAGICRNPDPVLNPKKKIFETVAPDLKTNNDKIATYKGIPFEVIGKGTVSSPSLVNVNIK